MTRSALKYGLWTQENTIVSISILLFIGIALNKHAGSCIVICPTRSSLYWPLAICDDHLSFNIQRIERYSIVMYVLAPEVNLLELKSKQLILFLVLQDHPVDFGPVPRGSKMIVIDS